MREVAEELAAWNGFYVMLGSAAAALTGLMFVVITLVTDRKRGTSEAGISTFSTPTVVHFSCALFTSALMTAPFRSFVPLAVVLGIAGVAGVLYQARVAYLTSRLQAYRADTEDIVWHLALPILAYAALVCGAMLLPIAASEALLAPAASTIILILIGIHNAWDVVTFLAIDDDETSD